MIALLGTELPEFPTCHDWLELAAYYEERGQYEYAEIAFRKAALREAVEANA